MGGRRQRVAPIGASTDRRTPRGPSSSTVGRAPEERGSQGDSAGSQRGAPDRDERQAFRRARRAELPSSGSTPSATASRSATTSFSSSSAPIRAGETTRSVRFRTRRSSTSTRRGSRTGSVGRAERDNDHKRSRLRRRIWDSRRDASSFSGGCRITHRSTAPPCADSGEVEVQLFYDYTLLARAGYRASSRSPTPTTARISSAPVGTHW